MDDGGEASSSRSASDSNLKKKYPASKNQVLSVQRSFESKFLYFELVVTCSIWNLNELMSYLGLYIQEEWNLVFSVMILIILHLSPKLWPISWFLYSYNAAFSFFLYGLIFSLKICKKWVKKYKFGPFLLGKQAKRVIVFMEATHTLTFSDFHEISNFSFSLSTFLEKIIFYYEEMLRWRERIYLGTPINIFIKVIYLWKFALNNESDQFYSKNNIERNTQVRITGNFS